MKDKIIKKSDIIYHPSVKNFGIELSSQEVPLQVLSSIY